MLPAQKSIPELFAEQLLPHQHGDNPPPEHLLERREVEAVRCVIEGAVFCLDADGKKRVEVQVGVRLVAEMLYDGYEVGYALDTGKLIREIGANTLVGFT